MRLKLDENLGQRGAQLLRDGSCDVATVVDEDLCSSADATLIEVCRAEKRVLITLDKDFSNTLRFRPSRYTGIIVLRLPEPLRQEAIENALQRFLTLATSRSPVGKLWLIDNHRIREFAEDGDDE
jgi:predicted nuclease of predicted toxin-antitoxin system